MSDKSILTKLDEKIRDMGRKTYLYAGHPVRIIDWEMIGTNCRLETTRQILQRPFKELLTILENEFTEAEYELPEQENLPAQSGKNIDELVTMPKLKSLQVCENLGDALMRAMDEVEHNPAFKDQAQVMANLMGKGIDYVKVELEVFKLARDVMRNR